MKRYLLCVFYIIPYYISSKILKRRFGIHYYMTFTKYGHYKLAISLAIWDFKNCHNKYSKGPPILIAGVSRVGKSIISQSVAEKNNYKTVNLDHYRWMWINDKISPKKTKKLKTYFFLKLLSHLDFGVLIEGDELITDSYSEAELLNVDYLKKIKEIKGVQIVVLGCSEDSTIEKSKAIIDYGSSSYCWATRRLSHKQLIDLVNRNILLSQYLADFAMKENLKYFEIKSNQFERNSYKVIRELTFQ